MNTFLSSLALSTLLAAAPLLSAQDGWFDFDPPKDSFTDQALLDLRFLNEREAGENGRIVARGEHFVHEATGEPVRFWGVNRGQWDAMSQKEWQEAESVYRSWWEKALTERNPHTGMTLGEDPAVMGLELVNEDSFFFWTFPGKVPERYLATLRKEFGDWAADKYGSLDKAMRAWDGAKVDGDDLAQGELGFPHWSQVPERKSARDKDTVRFLALKQRGWADETIDWMKGDLGFGGLVVVGNWITANAQTLEPVERWTYLDGDFTDKHAYFGNYAKGDNAAWSIRTGHVIGDRALTKFMPKDPTEAEIDFDVPWLRPTWNNMPKMVSETSWLRTNRYRAEAPLFYAAYGALNGTDAYTHFWT